MTCSSRLVIALIAMQLAACATTPPIQPEPVPPPVEAPRPVEPAPLPPIRDLSKKRITLAAVGDMMLGTDYPKNHLPDDDGVGFLADVTPILRAADITFGNLEGVLVDGGEPGKKCSNPSACYLFRSPTRYATHFKDAGFDVMSLANNHARDFGEDGRTSSMDALWNEGIAHTGREGTSAFLKINGVSIAFIAYAVTKNSNMMLDYEFAFDTVAALARRHDIVVVSFHGGAEGADVTHVPFAEEEYYGEPRGDVVWFARGVVDAGADLVVGHGPHVVRGMERYNGRLIAYSLGNFATYYGISVAGVKGIAPVVTATLDGNGVFVNGQITSTVQLRPAGPSIDDAHRALNLLRGLSIDDFDQPGLKFGVDGQLLPVARPPVKAHVLVVSPD